jgi:hypothetical protein
MYREIKNWHIVKTKEEMVAKASELLQTPHLPHERVMTYSVINTAKAVRKLFYPETNQ